MILNSLRLKLRPLLLSDWELISFLRTDNKVNKYVERSSAPTQEEAQNFIFKIEKGIQSNSLQYWVILIESTKEAIGTICLWNYSKDMKTVEIGYELKPQYQDKGYMTESMKLVIAFAFETMRFERILAYTHAQNGPSTKLLQKNNFVLREGMKDADNANNVIYELNF